MLALKIGVLWPQVKECPKPQCSKEETLPQSLWREHSPLTPPMWPNNPPSASSSFLPQVGPPTERSLPAPPRPPPTQPQWLSTSFLARVCAGARALLDKQQISWKIAHSCIGTYKDPNSELSEHLSSFNTEVIQLPGRVRITSVYPTTRRKEGSGVPVWLSG